MDPNQVTVSVPTMPASEWPGMLQMIEYEPAAAVNVRLAVPAGSDATDEAKTFIEWATSKGYTELVASKEGWANVPPGTRTSLYENQNYLDAAPFAEMTLNSINAADPTNPSVDPVPYTGVQFVAIPEFAGIGTQVGQEFSAALAGQQSVDEALAKAQALTTDEMEAAGY